MEGTSVLGKGLHAGCDIRVQEGETDKQGVEGAVLCQLKNY